VLGEGRTDGQLDLLGFGAPEKYFRPTPPHGKVPAKAHQLFLALKPQRSDTPRLSLGTEPLKQRIESASAKAVLPDVFHITLLDIDHFLDVYLQIRLDAIEAACSGVASPTIPALHNRLMSFPPAAHSCHCAPPKPRKRYDSLAPHWAPH